MRRVEHDRASGVAHDRERAHVGDQVVITERRAALAHEMLSVPLAALRLGDNLFHVVRREKLPLLDVDGFAGCRDRLDEIGLAAQERWGLQHVDHRGGGRNFLDRVDVGQHRDADMAPDVGENAKTFRPCRDRETMHASCDSPCRTTT